MNKNEIYNEEIKRMAEEVEKDPENMLLREAYIKLLND